MYLFFSLSSQVIIQMRLCRILCHGAFLRWNRFYVTMSNMNGIDSHDIGPDRTFRVNKSHVLFVFLLICWLLLSLMQSSLFAFFLTTLFSMFLFFLVFFVVVEELMITTISDYNWYAVCDIHL